MSSAAAWCNFSVIVQGAMIFQSTSQKQSRSTRSMFSFYNLICLYKLSPHKKTFG